MGDAEGEVASATRKGKDFCVGKFVRVPVAYALLLCLAKARAPVR